MRSTVLSFLFGFPGFALQLYGLVQGNPYWAVAGTVLHVVGLSYYISAKGYPARWGIWGVVPVVGFFILLMQWPRLSNMIVPDSRETLAKRKKSFDSTAQIVGGYKLLAALAPLGIGLILFCGYFWGDEPEPLSNTQLSPSVSPETKAHEETKAPAPKPESTESPNQFNSGAMASWSDKVQEGMTYQEVVKLSGNKGEELVFSPTRHGIVRWKTPSGSDLYVRFHGDRVVSSSNKKTEATGETKTDDPNVSSTPIDSKLAHYLDSVPKTVTTESPNKDNTEVSDTTASRNAVAIRLPEFMLNLAEGPRVVRLVNPNNVSLKAGIRLGNVGKDVAIPPNESVEVHVPEGQYQIHFIREQSPDRVCSAGTVQVGSDEKPRDLELRLPETPVRKN